MGLSSALRWWEEWQLRVLVLSSLGVQCLLAIFGGRRKSSIPPWYRLFIWLSYLGSDALAIYALATLFNRQKKVHYNDDASHDLEAVWAPILLIHLGGQIFITAYNIEDNELHVETAHPDRSVSGLFNWLLRLRVGPFLANLIYIDDQITVALYVFFKSWSSSTDRRLFVAEILLFIVGIVKCFEKPMALKAASFNSLVSSKYHAQRDKDGSREKELESFVKDARASVIQISQDSSIQLLDTETMNSILNQLHLPNELFVDSTHPFSVRLNNLKFFWSANSVFAYYVIQDGLSNIFNLLYTRNKFRNKDTFVATYCCLLTWPLTLALAIPAIGLLHSSHKQAYNHNDVIVTFVMVYGTLLLHIISVLIILMSTVDLDDAVPQQSLIGFYAHNKRHEWSLSIIECLQCKSLLDQYWCMKPYDISRELTGLVYKHVRHGWIEYIHDAESYRNFNDNMGWWALECAGCDGLLGWSLEKQYDEVVLLWHVATDFCFHMSYDKSSHPHIDASCREMGRAISNYMTHLLFANPEMLMAGSRRNVFTAAYDELVVILEAEKNLPLHDEEKLTLTIIDKVKSKEGSFIHDAWRLAQGLKDLGDEQRMWTVITNVWVEMLCFSTGRCRGYLHAKSLGTGVEYLSYVWLLLSHAGMETFPERLQRRHQLRQRKEQLHDREDDVINTSDSDSLKLVNHKEEENPAISLAPQDEGSIAPELKEIVVSP